MRKTTTWISFLLTLAMVVTLLVPASVQAAGKVVTVGTQAELEAALADSEVTKIAIKAKKSKTLTIPEGDYSDVALVVEAANVRLNNYGTFDVIKIRDVKKYMDYAEGNVVKVTDDKLTLGVEKEAVVEALYLTKKDADTKIVIRGIVEKITASEDTGLDLTVHGDLNTLNLQGMADVDIKGKSEETIICHTAVKAEEVDVTSSVTIIIYAKNFVEATFEEGAEGSYVVMKTEETEAVVNNNTEEETKIIDRANEGFKYEVIIDDVVDTRDKNGESVGEETQETPGSSADDKEDSEEKQPEEEQGNSDVYIPTVIPTFTVTFDSGVGSVPVYYGQTVNRPADDPVREGYNFLGWVNSSTGNLFDFSTPVTTNYTLVAKWEKAVSVWDGTADISWYEANPDAVEFTLTEANELAGLATLVDSGNTFVGKIIKLDTDFDFGIVNASGEAISFDPIGDKSPFAGTLDGQGHTISNIYQSGWDFGYEWGAYGSIGLFGELQGATIKNVTIDGFDCQIEGGDIGGITGSATGACVFENITIKNSKFGTYNNGIGGIIGWSGAGDYTFKNINIGSDVILAGLWGSFDSSIGGVVGQGEPGATYNFEKVNIACRLDAYNDCTAAYDYYNYRMSGMIIGRLAQTTTIDGVNYPDTSKYNITCTDVTVNYGNWMNYHYCRKAGESAKRVEAGYAYGGIAADYDHSLCAQNDHHMNLIPFDQIFGGAQYGVKGLKAYEGVTVNYPTPQ